MSILDKFFGDANEKYLKKLQPMVEKINFLEPEFEKFSDEKLKEKTVELKQRLNPPTGGGETLDNVLPESFASVREAAKRTLGQRHFDCQLIGGIVLHQGKIAEMKTGEGKTLSATLPLVLNALEEKGCHLVTVNDYLAKRDTVWMGQIYHALGLSVGCIVHDNAYLYDPTYQTEEGTREIKNKNLVSGKNLDSRSAQNEKFKIKNDENGRDEERDTIGAFKVIESFLRPCSRKEAYLADITYGTNNEFGFDYLRDNMVYDLKDCAQRGFNYAIVDEVDSILIDEARTPLIISAPDTESSKWYADFARIIPKLKEKDDYEIDEKMRVVTLTEEGINKIEKILGMGNIYEEKGIKYLHHLEQALRAEVLFKRDRDYVVKPARNASPARNAVSTAGWHSDAGGDGEVMIIDEFTGRLMPGRRWSGGLHQAIEAKEGVNVQPESLTLATITFQNYFRMYKKMAGMTGTAATSAEEFDKVYKLEVAIVPTNKPMVRVGLADRIYKTQEGKIRELVKEIKERHEKGQPILVGTRSVEKNEYLGKLLEREGIPHQILNAKHHEREGEIIAQAGKLGQVTIATNMAGRGVDIILGGNPLDKEEAEKIVKLGGLHIIGTERHEARRIDNQLRGRSGRQGDPGSSQFFVSLEDELLKIFGGEKIKSLMSIMKIPEDQPIETKIISGAIESAQGKIEGFNFDVRKHVLDYDDVMNKHRGVIYKKRKEMMETEEWKSKIENFAESPEEKKAIEEKEKELGENFNSVARVISLRTLDMLWMNHLEEMEYLRDAVRLRAYGQQDPLVEYKNEGHKMFHQLLQTIERNIVQTITKVSLTSAPTPEGVSPISQPLKSKNKPGRNDPCPCGAKHPDGRPIKYKHCCGK